LTRRTCSLLVLQSLSASLRAADEYDWVTIEYEAEPLFKAEADANLIIAKTVKNNWAGFLIRPLSSAKIIKASHIKESKIWQKK